MQTSQPIPEQLWVKWFCVLDIWNLSFYLSLFFFPPPPHPISPSHSYTHKCMHTHTHTHTHTLSLSFSLSPSLSLYPSLSSLLFHSMSVSTFPAPSLQQRKIMQKGLINYTRSQGWLKCVRTTAVFTFKLSPSLDYISLTIQLTHNKLTFRWFRQFLCDNIWWNVLPSSTRLNRT